MRRFTLPCGPSFYRRLLNLVHKIIKIECPIINHLLHFGHLHLRILIEELLNTHEAAPDTHDQPPRDELHIDLPRAEYIVAVPESLNGHRLSQRVKVLGYQFIDKIPFYWSVPGETRSSFELSVLLLLFLVLGGRIVLFVVELSLKVLNQTVAVAENFL